MWTKSCLTLHLVEPTEFRGVESMTADGLRDDLRGIGEMSRDSGLTISALRFYDRVGLLVPVEVDPETGYRRYDRRQVTPARLVAGLRRVRHAAGRDRTGLGGVAGSGAARRLIDAHLRRLGGRPRRRPPRTLPRPSIDRLPGGEL